MKDIKWSDLPLGKKPDSQIAIEFGLDRRKICQKRNDMGIPAFKGLTLTQEGKPCRSIHEAMYDAYLHWKDIKHDHEVPVEFLPFIADFKIGNKFVEIFGMKGFSVYDAKMRRKKKAYRKHHINFEEMPLKTIETLYQNCPLRVNYRDKSCEKCGKTQHRIVKGYCYPCYMKLYHERPLYDIVCKKCGKKISMDHLQQYCSYRCYWDDNTRITWPSLADFKNMLTNNSMRGVARLLGVTLSSVQRRIRKLNITL